MRVLGTPTESFKSKDDLVIPRGSYYNKRAAKNAWFFGAWFVPMGSPWQEQVLELDAGPPSKPSP